MGEFRKRLPETRILLLGIFPRGPTPKNRLRQRNEQVNELLGDIAHDRHIDYLDIGEHFLDKQGLLHREIMFDFLHPTVRGYQIWAEAIGPKIAQLMSEAPKPTEAADR